VSSIATFSNLRNKKLIEFLAFSFEMYLPTFYKIGNELFMNRALRYGQFGLPVLAWGKI